MSSIYLWIDELGTSSDPPEVVLKKVKNKCLCFLIAMLSLTSAIRNNYTLWINERDHNVAGAVRRVHTLVEMCQTPWVHKHVADFGVTHRAIVT